MTNFWAVVDTLVLILLLVLRFIWWNKRSSSIFLFFQFIILIRWCYMLSAKRLVLDFKNRNEQGPPREREGQPGLQGGELGERASKEGGKEDVKGN